MMLKKSYEEEIVSLAIVVCLSNPELIVYEFYELTVDLADMVSLLDFRSLKSLHNSIAKRLNLDRTSLKNVLFNPVRYLYREGDEKRMSPREIKEAARNIGDYIIIYSKESPGPHRPYPEKL